MRGKASFGLGAILLGLSFPVVVWLIGEPTSDLEQTIGGIFYLLFYFGTFILCAAGALLLLLTGVAWAWRALR